MSRKIAGKTLASWKLSHPLIQQICQTQEVFWWNRNTAPIASVLPALDISADDIADASARLQRFAPLIARLFPETASAGGIIESPLVTIPAMHNALCHHSDASGNPLKAYAAEKSYTNGQSRNTIPKSPEKPSPVNDCSAGRLLLKCDYALPVSGSIKARGGIYEVLKHAETLAIKHGLLCSITSSAPAESDYAALATPEARTLFGQYSIAVGSTGNLGLSIGIMGAALGFNVTVHMSADARQWKKDMLRSKGVNVVEYEADYGKAVEQGRAEAAADPSCHFIDDENSRDLFLGYAVAGERVKAQFDAMGIVVDAKHPLFVYLPCGVGGGPGGVAFGLKCAFGDHVHCFFAEPTHSPAMLLGLYTEMHDAVSAQDFGLDNLTAADGLAVGRPSGFVGRRMARLIDGVFTVNDDTMHRQLALLADTENIRMEPSALAGMSGILLVSAAHAYLRHHDLALSVSQATHLVWGTGGSMVPDADMLRYYALGKMLQQG